MALAPLALAKELPTPHHPNLIIQSRASSSSSSTLHRLLLSLAKVLSDPAQHHQVYNRTAVKEVGPAESLERCSLWLNDAEEMSLFRSMIVINRPLKLLHRLKMLLLSAHGICVRRNAEKA